MKMVELGRETETSCDTFAIGGEEGGKREDPPSAKSPPINPTSFPGTLPPPTYLSLCLPFTFCELVLS